MVLGAPEDTRRNPEKNPDGILKNSAITDELVA